MIEGRVNEAVYERSEYDLSMNEMNAVCSSANEVSARA